jgi:hypothetical protein
VANPYHAVNDVANGRAGRGKTAEAAYSIGYLGLRICGSAARFAEKLRFSERLDSPSRGSAANRGRGNGGIAADDFSAAGGKA